MYGNDAAKLRSVAALDLLALNNPAALEAISQAGGQRLLQGARGFVTTLVAGRPVVENDAITGERPGRLVRFA